MMRRRLANNTDWSDDSDGDVSDLESAIAAGYTEFALSQDEYGSNNGRSHTSVIANPIHQHVRNTKIRKIQVSRDVGNSRLN